MRNILCEIIGGVNKAVPRVEPDGPRGYLEMVLSVYGPLVSYVPDGD